MSTPTKEQVREVVQAPDLQDLPDGAYWGLVHDRLGLEYGEVFGIIAEDTNYFGLVEEGKLDAT